MIVIGEVPDDVVLLQWTPVQSKDNKTDMRRPQLSRIKWPFIWFLLSSEIKKLYFKKFGHEWVNMAVSPTVKMFIDVSG